MKILDDLGRNFRKKSKNTPWGRVQAILAKIEDFSSFVEQNRNARAFYDHENYIERQSKVYTLLQYIVLYTLHTMPGLPKRLNRTLDTKKQRFWVATAAVSA